MKKLIPVVCAVLLSFGSLFVQPALGSEGEVVVAGLRIVPDPDFLNWVGGAIRSSDVIEGVLRDRQGRELGQVQDLVVHRDGRLAYVVISVGEPGDRELIPIPFRSIRFMGFGNGLFFSNTNKGQLKNAPSIRKGQWDRLEDPSFENEIFSYYGEK